MANNHLSNSFWILLEKIRDVPMWVWAIVVVAIIAIDVSQNPNCCTPGAADDSPPIYGNPNKGY